MSVVALCYVAIATMPMVATTMTAVTMVPVNPIVILLQSSGHPVNRPDFLTALVRESNENRMVGYVAISMVTMTIDFMFMVTST